MERAEIGILEELNEKHLGSLLQGIDSGLLEPIFGDIVFDEP
jgi:hypothetical protein